MVKLRNHYLFIIITIIYLGLRIFASDPWTGATITNDTNSYVTTSKESVFSKQFLSGARPITLPLLYKIFTPPGGYDTSIRSEPSLGIIPGLQEHPGFSQIAFVQSSISVFSWWVLALALYRRLKNNLIKYLGVLFILVSSCLPEIVSWDHVMMAESLSYSLFALILALSLMIFQKEFFTGEPVPSARKWLFAGFIIVIFLWVNARDTNAYFLLVTFFFILIGLMINFFRKRYRIIPWSGIVIIGFLLAIFAFQQSSARASTRLVNPLINNLTANVFPYHTRVKFMHEKWGMPDSPEIISNTNSANFSDLKNNRQFVDWVHQKGLSAYTDFMIHTPLWTGQMLINSFKELFGYYKQPYFDPWEIELPVRLKNLTPLINWSSSDLIIISFLLIIFASARNISQKDTDTWIIVGIMTCLWIGAGIMYAAGYLGETWGSAPRHIQNAILTYRLTISVFLPLLFDQ